MCGLVCIFSYGSETSGVEEKELWRIRDHMLNRGPDSSGAWISNDGRIGLAHRRLSILDVSDAGIQPMLDDHSGNRIVFNGEIYNFRELKSDLESIGLVFKSKSDTEVLLKLYSVYGEKMTRMLRGMFAFVIWDETKQTVFAARDHFGIKPLYVSDDGQTLRVASQVKALLAGGAVEQTIEPAGHVGFFLWGFIPEPFTMYKSIRALPAGTSLEGDTSGKVTYTEFFNLSHEYKEGINLGKTLSIENNNELVHEALLDSVRHHLIADVPVGVFLSAGLDSCSIANLAIESGEESLHTLTLGFEEFRGSQNDEVPLAELVGKHLGSRHSTHRINSDHFAEHHDDILKAMDQPSIDGINTYFVCMAAREAGLKVALSGLGGDELFGGYSYFRTIPKVMRIANLLRNFPQLGRGFRKVTAPVFLKCGKPKLAGLFEFGGDYSGAYFLNRANLMPWEVRNLLGKDLFEQGWENLCTIPAIKNSLGELNSDREAISALELQWYMRSQLLRDSDWASMAHSVEVRVPFVDIELFRTVAVLVGSGLPPNKSDMARACKNQLPLSVLNRPKTGFSVPVEDWLLNQKAGSTKHISPKSKSWSERVYRSFT